MTPIEQTLLAILIDKGPIRGTAHVGYALWPDREMQPQGAAVAAGKILRRLIDQEMIESVLDQSLARYQVTRHGYEALKTARQQAHDPRQLSLLD